MTTTILDGAGHNPQIETPEIVQDLVGHWLGTLAESVPTPPSGRSRLSA